jgi:uncharacterized protein YdhG (YjbR/CyaY superfamily)
MSHFKNIDDYISAQSPEVATRLAAIRALFHTLLPETEESIRYDMPAFTVGGGHLYMSAYKSHIGMYSTHGVPELEADMLPYRGKGTKDALHFKHTEPLPMELIEKIIRTKTAKIAP